MSDLNLDPLFMKFLEQSDTGIFLKFLEFLVRQGGPMAACVMELLEEAEDWSE